jgi:hypothetical protein
MRAKKAPLPSGKNDSLEWLARSCKNQGFRKPSPIPKSAHPNDTISYLKEKFNLPPPTDPLLIKGQKITHLHPIRFIRSTRDSIMTESLQKFKKTLQNPNPNNLTRTQNHYSQLPHPRLTSPNPNPTTQPKKSPNPTHHNPPNFPLKKKNLSRSIIDFQTNIKNFSVDRKFDFPDKAKFLKDKQKKISQRKGLFERYSKINDNLRKKIQNSISESFDGKIFRGRGKENGVGGLTGKSRDCVGGIWGKGGVWRKN